MAEEDDEWEKSPLKSPELGEYSSATASSFTDSVRSGSGRTPLSNPSRPVIKVRVNAGPLGSSPASQISQKSPEVIHEEDHGAFDSSRSNPSAPKLKIKVSMGSSSSGGGLGQQTVVPPVSSGPGDFIDAAQAAIQKSLDDLKMRRAANGDSSNSRKKRSLLDSKMQPKRKRLKKQKQEDLSDSDEHLEDLELEPEQRPASTIPAQQLDLNSAPSHARPTRRIRIRAPKAAQDSKPAPPPAKSDLKTKRPQKKGSVRSRMLKVMKRRK